MSRRIALATGFGLVFLVLYSATSCRTIYLGDSGELVLAARTLGIPHPPGYPLYCLVGRLFSFLPIDPVAMRLNLLSVFCGAASVALLFSIISRVCSLPAAAITVALFGISPLLWTQSTIAEVYTPHLLLFLGALGCLLREKSQRATIGGAYLTSLAILSHPTSLSLLPLLFYRTILEKRTALPALILFLAGLTSILYLPVRSALDPFLDWGNPESPAALVAHLFRSQYGEVLRPDRSAGLFIRELRAISGILFAGSFPIVLVPLLPAGMWRLFRTNRPKGIILTCMLLLLFPILVFFLAFPLAPERVEENSVFFLPALSLLFIFLAAGLGTVSSALRGRLVFNLPLAALLLVLVFHLFTDRLPAHRYDQVRLPEEYARQVLQSPPEGAYLEVAGDDLVFPLLYLREVEGVRRDLVIHNPGGNVYGRIKALSRPTTFRYASFPKENYMPWGLVYYQRGAGPRPKRPDRSIGPDNIWKVVNSSESLRSLWINYEEMQARGGSSDREGLELAAGHRLRAIRLSSPAFDLAGERGLNYARSTLLADRGEVDKAIRRLQRAVSGNPDDLHSRMLLAELLVETGRLSEGGKYADVGDDAPASMSMRGGAVLLLTGNIARGVELLKQAVHDDPRSADALQYLVRVEERRKAWHDLIAHGMRALEIDPDLDDIRLRVARAHEAAGDRGSARREYENLLRSRRPGDAAMEARNWLERNGLLPSVPPDR